ncbi:MAG: type I-U CRISPR-associated protein Csx17 [Nocardiopsaceae bacterium]|nr:type I-U CRISPR-associated protein Csx17 [Nocardiopsaceae bacterium]
MTSPTPTLHLSPGLGAEPLASYLASLGLVRVLGEQADPAVTATWTPDGVAITTAVPDIAVWLADEYIPTPVVSPWNGGSGFGAKDKEPIRRFDRIRKHPSPRLNSLRNAIGIATAVVATAREREWITDSGVMKASKSAVVQEFRNKCPEELLPWIDAAIVLTGADAFFPPILGTGGNDGHLDFSTNFHEQLLEVVAATDKERDRSLAAARDLLFDTQVGQLTKVPIGQFDPGNAGGPGSSRFGAAAALANSWSYVLMVEGALLFASGTVRRNQHGAGRAAMPFTVTPSPDGSDSGAQGEESRGEVWTPIWEQSLSLPEIKQLFAEARASWRGRPARRAADFYAAMRSMGVARGIGAFTRYGLQRRNGLAFVAVPLDRIRVQEKPSVSLAAKVEDWATRIGASGASTAVGEALRAFHKSHLEFARDGGALPLARLLAALTTLEMAVGRSGRAKEAIQVRYVPPAGRFLNVLEQEDSPELRVAAGLASCATMPADGPAWTMRQILLPADQTKWRDAPLVPGFGARPLHDVLADVLVWRSRTAPAEKNAGRFRGVPTFRSGIQVPAADLHAFAGDALDPVQLDLLLRACLALDWRGVNPGWKAEKPDVPVTPLALLHPLAAGLRPGNPRDDADDEPIPALSPDWPIRLTAGRSQVKTVHDEARARLLQAGWSAAPAPPKETIPDGTRIAAALVPRCLSSKAVLHMIASKPKSLTEELI